MDSQVSNILEERDLDYLTFVQQPTSLQPTQKDRYNDSAYLTVKIYELEECKETFDTDVRLHSIVKTYERFRE